MAQNHFDNKFYAVKAVSKDLLNTKKNGIVLKFKESQFFNNKIIL